MCGFIFILKEFEMNKPKLKLEYTLSQNKGNVPVIVLAAGASRRMQGTNKQLYEIGGVPLIIKTLQKFENNENISNIILVTRQEDIFLRDRLRFAF
jgi:2-C-methyl-D-erythritol 4-phosphate cytidylyltransferase